MVSIVQSLYSLEDSVIKRNFNAIVSSGQGTKQGSDKQKSEILVNIDKRGETHMMLTLLFRCFLEEPLPVGYRMYKEMKIRNYK